MSETNRQSISRSVKDNSLCTQLLPGGLDTHLECGYYQVDIHPDDAGGIGLPFEMCKNRHYIKAHLFVSESGNHNRLQQNRVVGQTLLFTTCTNGGVTDMYTRTGECLAHGVKWGSWSRMSAAGSIATADVTWDANSNINTFVNAGTYNIAGERLNSNDGLPIANSNPGHTINARLVVLDSSISGTGDTMDKCITQILHISNRTGGDGDVYVRTGNAATKNLLAGGVGWEQWGKLQQNIEVGQVSSLNDYINNGIYSGVYVAGATMVETFVMVVINNYALAAGTGAVRSISQFKYALNIDGTFSYKTRTGQGNTGISWGSWVDLGAADTADIQDNSITAPKLSTDVREKIESPMRPLFIAAGAEYNDSGADITKTTPWGETVTHKAGHYYLNGLGDITEEQMAYTYANSYVIYNIKLPRLKENDKKIRTIIPVYNSHSVSTLGKASYSTFAGCAQLEVLMWSMVEFTSSNSIAVERLDVSGSYMFNGCNKLKYVHPMKCTTTGIITNMFGGCTSLIEAKIYELKGNMSFSGCPIINKDSILCIIQNSAPTSAITVTLHPDAYSRLADDADIVAALEAQPLVSLVSA